MAATGSLMDRIDAEFLAADERIKKVRTEKVQQFQGRQQRLEKFEKLLDQLREIWNPRLEALAKKFDQRVSVHPHVEPGRRSATFEFQSELARIKLRFGVAPDPDVQNVSFTYDLEVIPILMKFESHAEIEFPLDKVDNAALGRWIDDRIVSFVQTYLAIHENQYYLKDHMVEDPIAKVRFPKYAAGATWEQQGKTYYFIDETTLKSFQQLQN
jgi:YHS domain-containing protein